VSGVVPTNNRSMSLTRTQRALITVVVLGGVIIAAIGFAGSYAAVRELAERKGFGAFSVYFPIGIDAGICVLLALDLLLTWMRIPFPLLRQTAWLLTVATIAFNGAASWPDPLGVGMHAVIPILFVVSVEAARHAIGRIADITADKHMEGVRLTRWLLSPIPTFKLWRRMKLWELRSYEQVIKLEQDRLIYQARLQSRLGRAWRRKAPVESLMPLRLAKYGVPLAETGPAGLAAAGIEPALLPPAPQPASTATQERELQPQKQLPPGPKQPQQHMKHDEHPQDEPYGRQQQQEQLRQREQQEQQQQQRQDLPEQQSRDDADPGSIARGTPRVAPIHFAESGTEQQTGLPPGQQRDQHPAAEPAADPQAHLEAVASARTNADAIRYALAANADADDSAIVTWLAQFGREVNRGQVYKVKQQAAAKKRRQLALADARE
jgi:hypothetical protein